MKNYSGTSVNGCSFIEELPAIISTAGNKRRIAIWRCSCGKQFQAAIGNVTSGQVKSCGCAKTRAVLERCTKHGHSPMCGGTKLYRFWQSMKDRCLNERSSSFKHYGGRGISMFCLWTESFINFEQWFHRHFGLDDIPPNLTMDRIDNDGDYSPDNLRLADLFTQANNRRNNRVIVIHGEKFTICQLARKIKMKPGTLRSRLNRGISVEKAIE